MYYICSILFFKFVNIEKNKHFKEKAASVSFGRCYNAGSVNMLLIVYYCKVVWPHVLYLTRRRSELLTLCERCKKGGLCKVRAAPLGRILHTSSVTAHIRHYKAVEPG